MINVHMDDSVEIYSPVAVARFSEGLSKRDEDSRRRLEAVVRQLREGEGRRKLGRIPGRWPEILEQVAADFPNFRKVVDSVGDQFALEELDEGAIRIQPTLLIGPAGCGKTEFVNVLAEELNLPVKRLDMSTAQTDAILTGTDEHWGNSRAGGIFDVLVGGKYANPLMILDEIDKCGTRYGGSPLNGLYSLLEPTTAERFVDTSMHDIELNASYLNWFATANGRDGIDAPILSRFTIFDIQQPNADQVAAIARNVYRRLREGNGWGRHFDAEPNERVIEGLADRSPREMRKVLLRAFGGAAREGRTSLEIEDVVKRFSEPKRRVGFL